MTLWTLIPQKTQKVRFSCLSLVKAYLLDLPAVSKNWISKNMIRFALFVVIQKMFFFIYCIVNSYSCALIKNLYNNIKNSI